MDPGGWNKEVTSQERATAITKLQRFLVSVVRDGPDAVTRATELANKFEQHEDYLRVIVTRMQQVQQRRRSISEETVNSHSLRRTASPRVDSASKGLSETTTELNETEKTVVRQKITRLVSHIPKIDGLLADIKNGVRKADSDLIRKLLASKSLIEKQSNLLPKNLFILSVNGVNNLLEQVQLLLQKLGIDQIQGGNAENKDDLNDSEQSLLRWLRTRRKDDEYNSTQRQRQGQTPISAIQLDRRLINNTFTERYIRSEILWLSAQYSAETIISSESWGYDVLCRMGIHKLALQLPLEYPSDRITIRAQSEGFAERFVRDYEMAQFRIFHPISLSAIIGIFRHLMTEEFAVNKDNK